MVSKDLLHPTLVVHEFSGSMQVNVDDRFRVTIEGCCPGRFGHHRSFRFNLIDDELEVLCGVHSGLVWGASTPNSMDFSEIDVLIEEYRFPQGLWKVGPPNPVLESPEGILLRCFITCLNLVRLFGKL